MGHNASRQKAEALERQRLSADLRQFLAPGWRIDPARSEVVEIPTVLGALMRRQSVTLRCQRADCRRRCALDLQAAVRAGFADARIDDLLAQMRCAHWDGCALKLQSATYPAGVPLVALVQHQDALIAIACRVCGARVVLPPREVILRLVASGRGDGGAGVHEVARLIRGPCRRCNGRSFASEVIWPRHAARP